MIEFFVEGIPAPQGSKTAKCVNGKAIMWEASKGVKVWRDTVTAQAQIEMIAYELQTIDQPVYLNLHFKLPRPKTATRPVPSVKPDLDKLIRSTCDALTKSGIYTDDALVVGITALKSYADLSETGCYIEIEVVDV
jgi:Holliday junction resolvase RusA-like endonuclease